MVCTCLAVITASFFVLSVVADEHESCETYSTPYSAAADAHNGDLASSGLPPGSTRSRASAKYMLLTPSSRVYADLPSGWSGSGSAAAVVTPALGARFVMYLVNLDIHASIDRPTAFPSSMKRLERFFYILRGALNVHNTSAEIQQVAVLGPGGFLYAQPDESSLKITVSHENTSIIQIDRVHSLESPSSAQTMSTFGSEQHVHSEIPDGEQFRLKRLLQRSNAFYDFNIHIMDFDPGEYLQVKEMHYNQHGLLMLEGQGIYMLDGDFMPVQAGDVIWMSPFCLQWYAALGKRRTRYFLYKDTRQDPLIT